MYFDVTFIAEQDVAIQSMGKLLHYNELSGFLSD